MFENASEGPFRIEWRPAEGGEHDLVMSATLTEREAVRRLAARTGGAAAFRIRAADGTEVVASTEAIAAWTDDRALPDPSAVWAAARAPGGDAVRAQELLGAFLSWSKARGVLDDAACRRISMAVQMELAGEARDTPP